MATVGNSSRSLKKLEIVLVNVRVINWDSLVTSCAHFCCTSFLISNTFIVQGRKRSLWIRILFAGRLERLDCDSM